MTPLRRSTLKVAAVAAICISAALAGRQAWVRLGPQIAQSPQYLIRPENITVTEQPAWIHADVKAEVIRDGGLTELNSLDPETAKVIERAFALHTWVARVKRVTKHYPGRATVELEYRRPVAMVEVPGGLYPVDANGVLLPPGNFAEAQVRDYLRISVGESVPAGPVGTSWGDPLVSGAAKVAASWRDRWKELNLYRVSAINASQARKSQQPGQYAVETRQGARIVWGHAPGEEQAEEAGALEKIERLVSHVRLTGPLDGPDDAPAKAPVDLSKTAAISVSQPH